MQFGSYPEIVLIQSLYNYLEYFKEIFFLSEINNSYKKIGKKFYLYDVGFTNLIDKNNLGQRFENVVFLSLLRKYENIKYIKNNLGEIDFFIEKYDLKIQVCYKLTIENIAREIKLLEKSETKNNILIYFDKEKNFNYPGIKIINFFEFEEMILEK